MNIFSDLARHPVRSELNGKGEIYVDISDLLSKDSKVKKLRTVSSSSTDVPLCEDWTSNHFANLRYLTHFSDTSTPFPPESCVDLAKYNKSLTSNKYSNLSLTAKAFPILVACITPYMLNNITMSVVIISITSIFAEIISKKFERAESRHLDAANKDKDILRLKISKLYSDMAHELVDQYVSVPAKATRVGHRNRRNSQLDAHQKNKIKCVKISNALNESKLRLIKVEMIKHKLYNLHYDDSISKLTSFSTTTLFNSAEKIKKKLEKKHMERVSLINETLSPLSDAVKLILALSDSKDQHDGETDQRFQDNSMFRYYQKAVAQSQIQAIDRRNGPELSINQSIPMLNQPVQNRNKSIDNKGSLDQVLQDEEGDDNLKEFKKELNAEFMTPEEAAHRISITNNDEKTVLPNQIDFIV